MTSTALPGTATTGDVLAGDVLAGALEDLLRWARRMPPPGGVSLPALAPLGRLSADGPAGVSAPAAAERVSQPAVSQMVERLERAGLVERTSDPTDRRAAIVAVTASGARLLAEGRRARGRAVEDLLGEVGPDDADLLVATAPALARLVTAASSSSPRLSPTTGESP